MSQEVKQREIKRLVQLNAAIDITNGGEDIERMVDNDRPLETVLLSHGINGINGTVLRGRSGTLYAITCHSTMLYRYI